MPVRIIGMIGVSPPPSATVHVIDGVVTPEWIVQTSQEHERAGYDEVLIGYRSASADGFSVAQYAGCHTDRLSFLVAHRPGRILPALAARKIATIDQLLKGRLSMHIIIGGSDLEMQEEGDYTSKDERYERGAEYLDVMRRLWTAEGRVDYEGRFYRVKNARMETKPFQQPYPTLLFGGSSEGALEMGARHCDVFAMFGEPLKETAERVADYRRRCAAQRREAAFNVSFRPVIADTEGKAWDKARRILASVATDPEAAKKNANTASAARLMKMAAGGEIQDECLWTPLAAATGGHGNTTCLVGTPEQVADAVLKYYDLGVSSFLVRGLEPSIDVSDFGRELIPRIRVGAFERDAKRRASAGELQPA
jgi:alkanesulfonate monooxygenase